MKKKMKKIIIVLLYLILGNFVSAQNTDSLWLKANDYFIKGEFEQAIKIYDTIYKSGYESAPLYYNMGNAYYKLNKNSLAILFYEKALQLSPNDEDIKYNLELANRYVVDKIEKIPVFFITGWINSLRNIFSSDKWAITSIVSFALLLLFISFYLYSRRYNFKKLSFWISLLFVIVFILSFYFSFKQKQFIINKETAIIINPSVTIKSSPDISGTDIFVLHEGTKVWIVDEISDWQEIKLSDGTKGWLKASDIAVI